MGNEASLEITETEASTSMHRLPRRRNRKSSLKSKELTAKEETKRLLKLKEDVDQYRKKRETFKLRYSNKADLNPYFDGWLWQYTSEGEYDEPMWTQWSLDCHKGILTKISSQDEYNESLPENYQLYELDVLSFRCREGLDRPFSITLKSSAKIPWTIYLQAQSQHEWREWGLWLDRSLCYIRPCLPSIKHVSEEIITKIKGKDLSEPFTLKSLPKLSAKSEDRAAISLLNGQTDSNLKSWKNKRSARSQNDIGLQLMKAAFDEKNSDNHTLGNIHFNDAYQQSDVFKERNPRNDSIKSLAASLSKKVGNRSQSKLQSMHRSVHENKCYSHEVQASEQFCDKWLNNCPLLIAASWGREELVMRILSAVESPCLHILQANKQGENALTAAASRNRVNCLRTLLNILTEDSKRAKAQFASKYRKKKRRRLRKQESREKYKYLRKTNTTTGDDVDPKIIDAQFMNTPVGKERQKVLDDALLCAAAAGHTEIMEILIIEGGADPYAYDENGKTIAHKSLEASDGKDTLELLQLAAPELLEMADVYGNTPLHYSSHRGQLKATLFLLQSGANPHSINMSGRTPIALAVVEQQSECVKTLYHYGNDPRPASMARVAKTWIDSTRSKHEIRLVDDRNVQEKKKPIHMDRIMAVWEAFFANAIMGTRHPELTKNDNAKYSTKYIDDESDGMYKRIEDEQEVWLAWEEVEDLDDCSVYYYNHITGETQWNVPGREMWEVMTDWEMDDKGYYHPLHYYFNVKTGRSMWDLSNFEEERDPQTGIPYYVDVCSGVSQWEVPPDYADSLSDLDHNNILDSDNQSLVESYYDAQDLNHSSTVHGYKWEDWQEFSDENGNLYYFNSKLNISKWSSEFEFQNVFDESLYDPEWINCFDEKEGAWYYQNTLTGDTVWASESPLPEMKMAVSQYEASWSTTISPITIWSEFEDENGFPYYFNEKSNETQWDKPNDVQSWISRADEEGRVYFENALTSDTQWNPPLEWEANDSWKKGDQLQITEGYEYANHVEPNGENHQEEYIFEYGNSVWSAPTEGWLELFDDEHQCNFYQSLADPEYYQWGFPYKDSLNVINGSIKSYEVKDEVHRDESQYPEIWHYTEASDCNSPGYYTRVLYSTKTTLTKTEIGLTELMNTEYAWQEAWDDEGNKYWINVLTDETFWDYEM